MKIKINLPKIYNISKTKKQNKQIQINSYEFIYDYMMQIRKYNSKQLDQQKIKENAKIQNDFQNEQSNNITPVASLDKISGKYYGLKYVQEFRKQTFFQRQEEIVQKNGYKTRKDYLQDQLREVIYKKKYIGLSFRYLMNQLFCGKFFGNKECLLLNQAIEQINQQLDIFVLLEKLNEIQKLKELLLQKQQIILFNFTPKPAISLTQQKLLPSRITLQKSKFSKQAKMSNFSTFLRSASKNAQGRLVIEQNNLASIAIQARDQADKAFDYNNDVRAYYKLYRAYDKLTDEMEKGIINPFEQRVNNNLIRMMGNEIKGIFRVSKHLFKINENGENKINKKTLIQNFLREKLKQRASQKLIMQSIDSANDLDLFSNERKNENETIIVRDLREQSKY